MQIDPNSTRTIRQKEGSIRIKKCLGKYGGCLLWWAPGVGKTFCITNLINKPLMEKFPDARIDICVGTSYLLDQWNERIKHGEHVHTWHSVYKGKKNSIKTKLLVIDEAHTLLGTKKYFKILEVFDFDYVIFLTATPRDEDISLLRMKFNYPIADKITYEQALAKGWVAERKTYNIRVDLPKKSAFKMNVIDTEIRRKLLYLDPNIEDPENHNIWDANYGNLEKVLESRIVGIYDLKNKPIYLDDNQSMFDLISKQSGNVYRYKSGKNTGKIKYLKDFFNAKKVAEVRGSTTQIILGYASLIRKLYQQKHDLLYNNPNKIKVVEQILEKVKGRKGFIACMRAATCDEIVKINPKKIAPYHNMIPTRIEKYQVEKVYKRKPNVLIDKIKKISCKKQLEEIANNFVYNGIDVLAFIKKIEAGADFPNVSWIINHSYTSVSGSYTQKTGRVTRKENDKIASVFNLISFYESGKETKEMQWAKKMLKKTKIECKYLNEITW